jgi:hypothetical protein
MAGLALVVRMFLNILLAVSLLPSHRNVHDRHGRSIHFGRCSSEFKGDERFNPYEAMVSQ